jgi:sec-independent protein translocase protein TatB
LDPRRPQVNAVSVAVLFLRGKMRRMFGIGPLELFALAAVALVVLGPRRLPEVAKQVGRFMAEVRRTTYDLRSTLDAELQSEDRDRRRTEAEERRRKFREERDQAKESGEWPPGGQQDATDRPQPTVDSLSNPSEQPYDSLKDAPAEPASEEAAPEPAAEPAPEPAPEPAAASDDDSTP